MKPDQTDHVEKAHSKAFRSFFMGRSFFWREGRFSNESDIRRLRQGDRSDAEGGQGPEQGREEPGARNLGPTDGNRLGQERGLEQRGQQTSGGGHGFSPGKF